MHLRSARALLLGASVIFTTSPACSEQPGVVGDSGHPMDKYTFNVASYGWDVQLYINKEAAFQDGAVSGEWNVTQFVVNGKNSVRIVARRDLDYRGSVSRVEHRLVRRTPSAGGTSQRFEVLCELNETVLQGRERFETSCEFEAEVPVRWSWQDVDRVERLTAADRKQIGKLIDALADAYRSQDPSKPHSLTTRWLCDDDTDACGTTVRTYRAGMEARTRKAMGAPHFTVTVLPEADRCMLVGEKVTVVYARQDASLAEAASLEELRQREKHVVYSGYPQDRSSSAAQRPWNIAHERLFFVRRDGVWHILLADWRL